MADHDQDLVALTADIVSAHVANNSVASGEVTSLISTVYGALSTLGAPAPTPEEQKPQGATTSRKSLSSSAHIISMIDGKPYKMLRRHISQHGYTPENYRETFGLARDYPMVAVDYTETRRALAHKIGLGRKPKAAAPAKAAAPKAATAKAATPKAAAPKKGAPRRTLKATFGDAVAAAKSHLGGE
jgi:predicted transcriptional regulator